MKIGEAKKFVSQREQAWPSIWKKYSFVFNTFAQYVCVM